MTSPLREMKVAERTNLSQESPLRQKRHKPLIGSLPPFCESEAEDVMYPRSTQTTAASKMAQPKVDNGAIYPSHQDSRPSRQNPQPNASPIPPAPCTPRYSPKTPLGDSKLRRTNNCDATAGRTTAKQFQNSPNLISPPLTPAPPASPHKLIHPLSRSISHQSSSTPATQNKSMLPPTVLKLSGDLGRSAAQPIPESTLIRTELGVGMKKTNRLFPSSTTDNKIAQGDTHSTGIAPPTPPLTPGFLHPWDTRSTRDTGRSAPILLDDSVPENPPYRYPRQRGGDSSTLRHQQLQRVWQEEVPLDCSVSTVPLGNRLQPGNSNTAKKIAARVPTPIGNRSTSNPNTDSCPPLPAFFKDTQPHPVKPVVAPPPPPPPPVNQIYDTWSSSSPSCVDGQLTDRSSYAVAGGGFSDIWTAYLRGEKVAVKVIRAFRFGAGISDNVKERLFKHLKREYEAWSSVSHENIVPLLGFTHEFTYSPCQPPAFVSPWMPNGSVIEYLRSNPTADRFSLIIGVISGLDHLHSRKRPIVHGDLRGCNILIDAAGKPRLTDFGLSRILNNKLAYTTTASEPGGSLRWMAPELFSGFQLHRGSDIWSFGMLILEIFTGKRPFLEIAFDPEVMNCLSNGAIPLRPSLDQAPALTDELWDVCVKCWHFIPSQRPSTLDILQVIRSYS